MREIMRGLFKRFSETKKKIKNDKFDVDEEGREIVDITITKGEEDFLSDFRPDGKEVISEDVAKMIESSTKSTSYNKDIHLRFSCKNLSAEKALTYQNAVRNYFTNEFAEKERSLQNNLLITILVFALAILSFGALFLCRTLGAPWAIEEFLDIVAWVFGWETVDLIFFQRQLIKYEQRKNIKIIYSKITFRAM